jgi:hypothetical protein
LQGDFYKPPFLLKLLVKIYGLSCACGLINAVENLAYGICLLGENKGFFILNNSVNPKLCFSVGGITVAAAGEVSNTAGREVGL